MDPERRGQGEPIRLGDALAALVEVLEERAAAAGAETDAGVTPGRSRPAGASPPTKRPAP